MDVSTMFNIMFYTIFSLIMVYNVNAKINVLFKIVVNISLLLIVLMFFDYTYLKVLYIIEFIIFTAVMKVPKQRE